MDSVKAFILFEALTNDEQESTESLGKKLLIHIITSLFLYD